jgi:hypothetical protein
MINMSCKIDTEDIPNNEIRICTNFSATDDFRASETDNCSEDSHLVIAIYVVLHSTRTVQVGNFSKKLNDCDEWYFLVNFKLVSGRQGQKKQLATGAWDCYK